MPYLDEDHDRFVNGYPGDPNLVGWFLTVVALVLAVYWVLS